MGKQKIEIDYKKEYESNNCGLFKIIRELEPKRYENNNCVKRMVRVHFVQTGYEKDVPLLEALKGKVSDPYYPTLFGIGYWGEGIEKGSIRKKEYDLWYTMLYRCYCKSCPSYKYYGAVGVRVCDRWHCLSNFIIDIQYIPNYFQWYNDNYSIWQLDKDYLQSNIPKNERIYSKETCIFLIINTNSRLAVQNKKLINGDKFSSQYYGLYKTPYDTYQCSVNINKHKYFLGTYDDEIAAATVYNYVAARCIPNPLLNNIPYMDIAEALTHNTSRKSIEFPDNIKEELKQTRNCSSQYIGVSQRQGSNAFNVTYYATGINNVSIGSFSNEIAAANAHNWYEMFFGKNKSINKNIPYMAPSEWLKYKSRYGKQNPVQMCHTIIKNN